MAWMAMGGLLLVAMNALMRKMTLEMDSFEAQFLRYLFGLLVMMPLLFRDGFAAYRPRNMTGQWWRGAMHATALSLFFLALPHVPLAEMTSILFTSPIFTLIGAAVVLRERVTPARWLAAAVGFLGVIVVVWPHLSGRGAGIWTLVMLASSPFFAASFLITKALTRTDGPNTIVMWQNITVTIFALPLALLNWTSPTLTQWAFFLVCGLLGSGAHLCMTRAFSLADISATQPVRFLDLIWSATFGFILFGEYPTVSALIGGAIIVASTAWLARREAMERSAAQRAQSA
jgi:drug/metabolite transporter (DMT)-like permease